MTETRRVLVQGAVFGAFAGAGAVFVMFWHIVRSATNAGAMVEGSFRPYRDDPSWHILLVGGLLLLVAGAGLLVHAWRKLAR